MFILSEAYYHNSEVIQDISQLTGYHDNQSDPAPPDALYPVAQRRPAFHTWEYWESVWNGRERWEDSPAVQTWMDVESILSARGIHRKWLSICRQGNVPQHTVCRLIIEGLACWSSVWCNWLKTNGLSEMGLFQAKLTGAIGYTASAHKPLRSLSLWTVPVFYHIILPAETRNIDPLLPTNSNVSRMTSSLWRHDSKGKWVMSWCAATSCWPSSKPLQTREWIFFFLIYSIMIPPGDLWTLVTNKQ